MKVDIACAGDSFAALKKTHLALVNRLAMYEERSVGISVKWAHEGTAKMWLWMCEHRRDILDAFIESSEEYVDDGVNMGEAFGIFVERLAAAQGMTVSRFLFDMPDCAERALCVDMDEHLAMTTLWYLRGLPETTLAPLLEAPPMSLNIFGNRMFGPRRSAGPEQSYLEWRFGSVAGFALHATGLDSYIGMLRENTDKNSRDIAQAAMVFDVPASYAFPLAQAGFELSAVRSAWAEKMPVEYALALADKGGMP